MQRPSFIDALYCRNKQSPPVWFMRQAGRSLSAFRAIRQQHSFQTCAFTPQLAASITRLPEQYLDVDALVLFSDILVIYRALGGEMHFPGNGKPPYATCPFVQHSVREVLYPVFETITRVRKESSLPLLGFAGAPLTVLSYFVEYQPHMLNDHKAQVHSLLRKITEVTREYIISQIDAGAQAIQLFDSWAGLLDIEKMQEFCFPYARELLADLPVPTIFFTKNSGIFVEDIAREIAPSCISIDATRPIADIRRKLGPGIALQGNLSPEILLTNKQEIERAAANILESMRDDPGFIFNLSHGVLPHTPEEHLAHLVKFVHGYHPADGGKEERIASGFPPD